MATLVKDRRLTGTSSAPDRRRSGEGILPYRESKQPAPSAPPMPMFDVDGGVDGKGKGDDNVLPSTTVDTIERLLVPPGPSAPSRNAVLSTYGGSDEEEQPIVFDEDGVPLPLAVRPPKVPLPVAVAVPSLPPLPPAPVVPGPDEDYTGLHSELADWKRRQRKMFAGLCLVIVALCGTIIGLAVNKSRVTDGVEATAQHVRSGPSSRTLVDHLYTYGALSVANPHMSNPGNKCIPGIRTYTEDISSGDDCNEGEAGCFRGEHFTNTDFAANFNNNVYPHPKMSTLALRWRDKALVEYIESKCDDAEDVEQYEQQWWPGSQPAQIQEGQNIHHLAKHYERRLVEVPEDIRGPLLEYASVSACHRNSATEVQDCLDAYSGEGNMDLPGVGPLGWEVLAFMNHQAQLMEGIDNDTVFVLKNDEDENHRKCIISFKGSETLGGDLSNFLFEKAGAGDYCGRSGVHMGVKDELWQITNNPQYQHHMKPALASCQELSCVGHSLGGALCNVFTMCANQGLENLSHEDDKGDFCSLVWNEPEL
ncbi:hypothetical protein ACHAXR_003807, partial [Thalassiosira sp. AJA248-18]